MDLDFLADLVGAAGPGAGAAIHAAKALAQAVQNVKVNKYQAEELSRRCIQLALSCEEACKGLEGTEFSSITGQITAVIEKANRRAQDWSSMNAVRGFASQSSIRRSIDGLFKDIDTCAQRFHIATVALLHKTQKEMDQIRQRDSDENREIMRNILDHVVTRGNNPQQSQSSQSTNAINSIQEILREGTFEERKFLRKQLREILGEASTNPLENQNKLFSGSPPQAAKVRQLVGPEDPESIVDSNDANPRNLSFGHNGEGDLILNPDGGIRAGTLVSLVERLTSYEPDPIFARTFLVTYKSFATSDEVLDLLIQRYRASPPDGLTRPEREEWSKVKQHVIRARVLNTLKTLVMEDGIMEKEDIYILQRVNAFLLEPDVAVVPGAKSLLAMAKQKEEELASGVWKSHSPPSIIPRCMGTRKLKLIQIDPIELARQLTLLESALYKRITPFECLRRFRGPKSGETQDCLADIIQLTNKIANWVVASILNFEDSQRRAAWVKHFIGVADYCRLLQNYSSMAAILAGLNSSPIRRLKKTWDDVSDQMLSQAIICESLLDVAQNFATCRNTLASINPPCVPFLGVYLTSLTFIHEGIEDKLPGNLINFGKQQRVAEVIREIQYWQSKNYDLAPLAPVMAYLEEAFNSIEVTNEEFFNTLSIEREPESDE